MLEPAPRTDPRRSRPSQRRASVRQRLRAGIPGRGAQARRLLRRRRRALPHGGHGHRRDPAEHPLGVAPQARRRSPRTTRPPASGQGRPPHRRTCSERLLDEEYGKLRAARRPGRARRLQGPRPCPSPGRWCDACVTARPSRLPWAIDLLNINHGPTTIWTTARGRVRGVSPGRVPRGTARGPPPTRTSDRGEQERRP